MMSQSNMVNFLFDTDLMKKLRNSQEQKLVSKNTTDFLMKGSHANQTFYNPANSFRVQGGARSLTKR